MLEQSAVAVASKHAPYRACRAQLYASELEHPVRPCKQATNAWRTPPIIPSRVLTQYMSCQVQFGASPVQYGAVPVAS
jgi:hypothetical protein